MSENGFSQAGLRGEADERRPAAPISVGLVAKMKSAVLTPEAGLDPHLSGVGSDDATRFQSLRQWRIERLELDDQAVRFARFHQPAPGPLRELEVAVGRDGCTARAVRFVDTQEPDPGGSVRGGIEVGEQIGLVSVDGQLRA
ncbi:MAG: hypothetical protein DMF53_20525, partial [Acidobacteria bacterium]